MSKHTPGPWEFTEAPANGSSQVTDADGYVIAMVTRGNRRGVNPTQRLVYDARLISAAPDMLEALQTIENDAGQVPGWLWDRIQAAIAKATGTDREVTEADVLGGGS